MRSWLSPRPAARFRLLVFLEGELEVEFSYGDSGQSEDEVDESGDLEESEDT